MNNNKEKQKTVSDIQRCSFQLTINNPKEHGFGHDVIRSILTEKFPTLRFYCMADEQRSTYHTHLYVLFSSRVRISKIKKHFPSAHIEVAHGSAQSNVEYLKKSGKWADTGKSETCIEGTYEEWGAIPTQKGRNMDMAELYEMIRSGMTDAQILAANNDYILHVDKIGKVRTTVLIDKYKGTRRLDIKVTYIFGDTGCGKTRDVLDEYGDADTYRVTDYNHPFDQYDLQPNLIFEEFRSQLPLSDMLNYLDVYPLQLPSRYYNKYACYHNVFIISNWPLESQYPGLPQEDRASWQAFLRRIHKVKVYAKDGTVTVYDSVNAYMEKVCFDVHISKTPFDKGPGNQQ